MAIWVIFGLAAIVIAVVIARMGRSSSTPAWHDAARAETLRSVLAGRGLEAQPAPKAPVPMPDFRLPIEWGWRSAAGAEATAGDARWVIYDAESRASSVAGCNSVQSSSGDTVVVRHTVVAVTSDRLTLPAFTLVPNVRHQLGQALPARLQEAGLGESKAAAWAARAASTLGRLDEHGTALPFPDAPGFADAFRVVGDDGTAVVALFPGEAIAEFRQRPWAIVEGQGRWLAVSRYTAAAYRTRDEFTKDGWLSSDSAGEVAALAEALLSRWGRPPRA
ncbi:MAG: hypothetical protein R2745_07595 [Vicinamibacterales bacterium]